MACSGFATLTRTEANVRILSEIVGEILRSMGIQKGFFCQ